MPKKTFIILSLVFVAILFVTSYINVPFTWKEGIIFIILLILIFFLKDQQLAKQSLELQKFKLAVEGASDHIIITDPEGIILYANNGVEKITGFSSREVVGHKAGAKDLWGGLMPLEFYKTLWETIKIKKEVFSQEISNKRKDGTHYIAQSTISPILDQNKKVLFFVGIERDITKAKDIDRMKTEFISLASHQLRTPLSAMKWFLELLLTSDSGKLTKDQTKYISNINISNERMIELVNSLLSVSRIESGRIVIDPKPTDIKTMLEGVIQEVEKMAEDKEIKLSLSVPTQLEKLNVDPKLMRNVYSNLVTNAIKYTPKNGKVSIIVSKKDDKLLSQVTDTGYGIPKEEQPKMFEKFFRAANILKKEPNGNGLGLYLVKEIVESSNGRIWFESKENEGTTFWFEIPLSGMKAKKGEVTIE
jgi:PAS domain S-box-containing protein